MNHSQFPLTRTDPVYHPSPLGQAARKQRRIEALKELEQEKGGVAASVRVRDDGKLHEYLTAGTTVSRADRVTISRWQLGLVAARQECKKCGGILSRRHAVNCAEVEELMVELIEQVSPRDWYGETMLDGLINSREEEMEAEAARVLVAVITKIEKECRGRERTENGFFAGEV